jgi:Tfp pilus assembly protein PilO
MLPSRIRTAWRPAFLRGLFAGRTGRQLKILAAAAFALAAANALLYVFAVLPASARHAEQQERLADLKRQHADALLFQKQKKVLSGLRTGALTQKDVPLLIKDLVQTARGLGLSVGAINSDLPTPGSGGLAALTFTVPVSGSYGSIKRYIYEIETSDRTVGIVDLRFDGDRKAVKLDMKLVTYLREE